jgi:hypothetical protein
MIRRGFWLAVGAATGIYGYRRVSAVTRRLSASLNPTGPAQGARLAEGARLGYRTTVKAARETLRFTRDVREGMDLYMAGHPASAGPTLSADRESADRESTTREPEDGH